MRQYKRKTVALVLASVLTVVGAFGASNYKNSIMSMKFEENSSGAVNMTIFTKTNYESSITPIKRDANTYVIMLPETNSQINEQPTLASDVESIDIRTMPYTNSSKGYTKITIKTFANTSLSAQNALYIPEMNNKINDADNIVKTTKKETSIPNTDNSPTKETINKSSKNEVESDNKTNNKTDINNQNISTYEQNESFENTQNNDSETYSNLNNSIQEQNTNTSSEVILLLLGGLLIITFCAYLFIKGKNKISEIIGEQTSYSIEDTDKKPAVPVKNKEQKNKIKKTINKLDKMYTKPLSMPKSEKAHSNIIKNSENKIENEIVADNDVIDLDELFLEQTKNPKEEETNENLDDFLADFFKDEQELSETHEIIEKNKELDKQNNELLNKIINNDSISFTEQDIININSLINVEFTDEFINEFINSYERTDTTKTQHKTIEQVVTDLLDIQNISFTSEDIEAIDKIMNVEIDPDFVSNLYTNPIQTKKIENYLKNNFDKKHNAKEILILNVKEELPDLSKELAKTKKIESNAKPQTVFCEEGYDVNVLKTPDGLPDLSLELKKPNKYDYIPSVDIIQTDEDWTEQDNKQKTIKAAQNLPDLNDVKAHPHKYEDKKSKVKANEKTLLKNLNSVVFKPLYNGNEKKEIEFSEKDLLISQDLNIELTEYSSNEPETFNDFKESVENQNDTAIETELVLEKQSNNISKKIREKDSRTEDLLNRTDKKQEKPKISKVEAIAKKTVENKSSKEKISNNVRKKCTVDGIDYSILAASTFTDNIGCYLATSVEEGYAILGYIGDKIFKIKQYEKVKNSNLQARISETLGDGTLRYIVRIGIHKFILDVSDDKMEYVMDLC